jgi:hypothetical protein
MHPFTEDELYAIARASVGLPWGNLSINPLVAFLIKDLKPKDATALLRLLGEDVTTAVVKIDPNAPPPHPVPLKRPVPDDTLLIPALPPEAQLSDKARKSSEQVGGWLTECVAWARKRSPMTPDLFLESGVLWAIGLAVARRCAAPLHKPIYPHLYVLWVAMTSIFKKTTGMEAIYDLVYEAMPHMLLPEENTPESFIASLGGKQPFNYEQLSPYEKKLEDLGRIFAAQRGLLLDEASSLFGATRKDYMQGHAEMIMRLYDAPHRYTRTLRSTGKIVIYEASLCILGATTPASLIRNINSQSWETGELARFALLYPDGTLPYDIGGDLQEYAPPSVLVARLANLHKALPKPLDPTLMSAEKPPTRNTLSCLISKDAFAAYDAYTKAVTYDLLRGPHTPDPRLHPNYARLHVQAMKVAVALAAIDWADRQREEVPEITLGHWAKAQLIAETWRASAHRLIDAMNRSEDGMVETRILDHLLLYEEGETLRDLTLRTGVRRKAIEEAIKALIDAGLVLVERKRRGERGPEATVYRAL